MLVLTTIQISRQWLLLFQSEVLKWSKLVNWVHVEDPFLQVWSQLISFMQLCSYLMFVWEILLYVV